MLTLLVKGTPAEVSDSAMLRDVPLCNVLAYDGHSAMGQVPEGYLSRVLAWYVEPAKLSKAIGYPMGTLLHYWETKG
jgi:hypothetical protein